MVWQHLVEKHVQNWARENLTRIDQWEMLNILKWIQCVLATTICKKTVSYALVAYLVINMVKLSILGIFISPYN